MRDTRYVLDFIAYATNNIVEPGDIPLRTLVVEDAVTQIGGTDIEGMRLIAVAKLPPRGGSYR